MQVVRQWTVQGNHVGAVSVHPFLAQVGALAQAAAHQAAGAFHAGQGAEEGGGDLGQSLTSDLPQIPGLGGQQGTQQVDRGAVEEGGGGTAVQQHGDVTPGGGSPYDPRSEAQPPPQPSGGGGGAAPVATMVTCPDASVHPAGYVCPKASALGAVGSFMSDWGLWALLGVGAAGGYYFWQKNKKKKAGVHDRETIPAWEAAGHV